MTKPTSSAKYLLFLIIGLVLVAIMLGGYKLLSNSSISPQTQQTSYATTNWETYENQDGNYMLKYPPVWNFQSYEEKLGQPSNYKGYSLFENVALPEFPTPEPLNRVSGEIKIITPNALRGEKWKNITKQEFSNPNSDFWLKGEEIGGGPGFTYYEPKLITLNGKEWIYQKSHPSTNYELSTPNEIANNYYLFLNNPTNEILMISFYYDDRDNNKTSNIKSFDQVLSTFKFN
ncbi:hypothetical protein HYT02_01245 [Candidatus Gottesmanbacteria bacterium]|nr:hypothetical protein [Candidatus Gottesmanbacteria bacterium]